MADSQPAPIRVVAPKFIVTFLKTVLGLGFGTGEDGGMNSKNIFVVAETCAKWFWKSIEWGGMAQRLDSRPNSQPAALSSILGDSEINQVALRRHWSQVRAS